MKDCDSWDYVLNLTGRAERSLYAAGIDRYDTKAVMQALLEGRMKPGCVRNYGWKAHEYLCGQMGIPVVRDTAVWGCPHCGHRGKQSVFRISNE